jgi:D-alanine-D-alanine ligase
VTIPLRRLLVLHEPEAAARDRLTAQGADPDIAAEIAFYLAQGTDFAAMIPEIRAALNAAAIELTWAALDDLDRWLPLALVGPDSSTLLWSLTDGFAWYRGSHATSLAALLGVPQFGSPPAAQHLCQDKFGCGAIARGLGLNVPPTALAENGQALSPLDALPPTGPYFVKPNTLGAKLGIEADSRAATLPQAIAVTRRLWQRYGDRTVIQPYIPGQDVRVSFMDLGRVPSPLGLQVIRTSSDTGFPTLANSLRMTRLAAAGTVDGLSIQIEPLLGPAAATIEAAARHLAHALNLRDYWSMDFRLDPDGRPWFLEFETCPAVTIYDFRTYLRTAYALDLPQALAVTAPLAHARRLRREPPVW